MLCGHTQWKPLEKKKLIDLENIPARASQKCIGALTPPRQDYEQCEGGHPRPFREDPCSNTYQMIDEISQNKILNIFLYLFLFQCLPFTF